MKKKHLRKVVTFFLLAISLMVFMPKAEAKAITKSEINKKISSLNSEIKKLKSQKSKEVAKEKKQKKGLTSVYGEVIEYSPLIIKDLTGEYLYVTDKKYLNNYVFAYTGYVRKTGETTVYYMGTEAYTCSICKSVKVSNKSAKIKESISKKSKALKKYQNALKDVFELPSTDTYKVGDNEYLDGEWRYSGKYNNLKWSSSDETIATVNAKGRVNALKEGTVTISAKASISGKVSKCRLEVVAEESEEKNQYNDYDIVNVMSSFVESMSLENGILSFKADPDSEYDVFTEGEKLTKIDSDEISYEIADNCIWQKIDYYIWTNNRVENVSSFEEIKKYVEKDRADFINGGQPNACLVEVLIKDNKVVGVVYVNTIQ